MPHDDPAHATASPSNITAVSRSRGGRERGKPTHSQVSLTPVGLNLCSRNLRRPGDLGEMRTVTPRTNVLRSRGEASHLQTLPHPSAPVELAVPLPTPIVVGYDLEAPYQPLARNNP
jgi:hypothetical protein